MPRRPGAGRRSRRGTPMPNATITASVDELTFLLLIGEGNLAAGVQRLVASVVKNIEDMASVMRCTRQLVQAAERQVGPDSRGLVQQQAVYQYIRENYWQMVEDLGCES